MVRACPTANVNVASMKETPRRKKMVTSSLNEMAMDRPGNRLVVCEGGDVTPPTPTPFYSRFLDRNLQTT